MQRRKGGQIAPSGLLAHAQVQPTGPTRHTIRRRGLIRPPSETTTALAERISSREGQRPPRQVGAVGSRVLAGDDALTEEHHRGCDVIGAAGHHHTPGGLVPLDRGYGGSVVEHDGLGLLDGE